MTEIEAYVDIRNCPTEALEAVLGVKNPVVAYCKNGTYKVVSRDDIADENEYVADEADAVETASEEVRA